MNWAEYLLEAMKEKGISYGKAARLTGTSYSFWHNQVHQVKGPPTLEKARKIAEELEMNVERFLNLVFKDRIIHYLEKQKLLNNHPTSEIRAFVKSIEGWAPEKGRKIRYIMLTSLKKMKSLGTEFACDNSELGVAEAKASSQNLKESVRKGNLSEGATVE
ncbi:MAG: helix-turn-helix transcriptional regulator [Desulfobacterales bacterium]|nr:helix-turn-helix transcriptional regulator [Desulfobacterales bacterium]